MGLRDVLTGIQNGPRGARQPSSGGGGISPLVLALLGLLAYKAFKGRGAQTRAVDRLSRAAASTICCAADWAGFSAAPRREAC